MKKSAQLIGRPSSAVGDVAHIRTKAHGMASLSLGMSNVCVLCYTAAICVSTMTTETIAGRDGSQHAVASWPWLSTLPC